MDLKSQKRATWFQQARYAVTEKSRAKIAIEQLVIDHFGNEINIQAAYTARSQDEEFWASLWDTLEEYWRIKAGIEGGNEEKLARLRYRQIKLPTACNPS